MMKALCVFCGSSPGARPDYALATQALGRSLARRRITLVYGGGRVGLMGLLADAAIAAGGQVTGVMPQSLVDREIAHQGLTDLRIVQTMHERKALMASLSDAFIALPGGLGTLEELCEVLTWAQLGIHRKPFGILNTAAYFDPFFAFLQHAVDERFMKSQHRDFILHDVDPDHLLDRLQSYTLPAVEKWLDREET